MPRVVIKQKGNRFEKADYHIPYYTTAFLNPARENEGDEEKEITYGQVANQDCRGWR